MKVEFLVWSEGPFLSDALYVVLLDRKLVFIVTKDYKVRHSAYTIEECLSCIEQGHYSVKYTIELPINVEDVEDVKIFQSSQTYLYIPLLINDFNIWITKSNNAVTESRFKFPDIKNFFCEGGWPCSHIHLSSPKEQKELEQVTINYVSDKVVLVDNGKTHEVFVRVGDIVSGVYKGIIDFESGTGKEIIELTKSMRGK